MADATPHPVYGFGESVTHPHHLPDVDAKPGTYLYGDGCTVIRNADGSSYYVPYRDPVTDSESDPGAD